MRVLFVCTGNTCRSPMAEAVARRVAAERGMKGVQVASAGSAAWEGTPASDGALLVALERDMDLSPHRARTLSREIVDESDLILVMGPHHLERAESLGGHGKTYLLTEYASRGTIDRPITDPFGGDLAMYRETIDELDREIRRAFERLAAEQIPGVS